MITRGKAALLRALPEGGASLESATPGKRKEESEGAETLEGQELLRKMQFISLDSDSEKDDDNDTEEDSDYSDQKEASVMSQSSEVSAIDLYSDDECSTHVDDESEVVQPDPKPVPVSIESLIAEKVLLTIKGGDLKKLTLDSCRSYLRYYGLRISGNKPVLIDRIKQHIELQQGVTEKYQAASFTINCTGDVCKGDVIKFKQNVYKSLAKRGDSAAGERIVVGRVVKESYGEKKQQHTFTVEVLWSAGYKPLPPMRQLLVKGRNLYRLRTYRQKWDDERLRKISLDEKHERGAAARNKRRETLRASGPRELTIGGRKELSNPYVGTGPNLNFPPGLRGGRGKVGPQHRSWFPMNSHLEPGDVLSLKRAVPQHSGFDAVRRKTNYPCNQPGGNAHDLFVQQRRPQTKSASDVDPDRDKTQSEKNEIKGLKHSNSDPRGKEFKRFNNSSAGVLQITGSQPPREENRISGAGPHHKRPSENSSPFRSDMPRWKNDVSNCNIPTWGVQHDLRASPLRQRGIFTGADPYVERPPFESDMPRWRNDVNNCNIISGEMQHDFRDFPLHQSGIVTGPDPYVDRRHIENKSPFRSDMPRWRNDVNNCNIPSGEMQHDFRAFPLHQSGIFTGPDPSVDRRHIKNRPPWPNRRAGDFNNGFVPDAGVSRDTRASPRRLQSVSVPRIDTLVDRIQNENKFPLKTDNNSGGRDAPSPFKDSTHKGNVPDAGVSQDIRASPLRRLKSTIVPRIDPLVDRRKNENKSPSRIGHNSGEKDPASLFKDSTYKGSVLDAGVSHDTRASPLRRVQSKIVPRIDPLVDRRQNENKSPSRIGQNSGGKGTVSLFKDPTYNVSVPDAGVSQDTRASSLCLQSKIVPWIDYLVARSQNENKSPSRIGHNSGRKDTASLFKELTYKGNVPDAGVSQDTRASPLCLQSKIVPRIDRHMARSKNENKFPLSLHDSGENDTASLFKDPVTGKRNMRKHPQVGVRNNENPPPSPHWVITLDGFHHTDCLEVAPQVELAKTQQDVSRNKSLDGRQGESRRMGVEQRNLVYTGGQSPSVGRRSSKEHFRCPNLECRNQGSKLCSYRLCVKCCVQQGRRCPNSKHQKASRA